MYDSAEVQGHYDQYGEREWQRLEKNLHGRVEYEVTLHILRKHLPKAGHILDAGSGPGRYAIELARMGYSVYLLDLSEGQVELARRKIEEHGVGDRITAVEQGDICDLSSIPDATFDAVLCLGGVLSYVQEQRFRALGELIRVAKPGSTLIISVMSLLGTFHLIGTYDDVRFLADIGDHVEWDPAIPFPDVLNSRPGSPEWHTPMTLYSSQYMEGFMEEHGCTVLEMASSHTITSSYPTGLGKISEHPGAVEMLFELERQFCTRAGLVDMGQRLIVAARTPVQV